MTNIELYIDEELFLLNDKIGQFRESDYDIDTKMMLIRDLVAESNALIKLKMFIEKSEKKCSQKT